MQRSTFYCLLAAICLSLCANAQSNDYRPNFIPPSPDASALGKYAEFPIGLSTGTIPIAVPLYTVSDGSLQVPINLSYHCSGNKVDEAASFAGLGFTLNAGGAIMRSVRNLPDDYPVKGFLDYNTTYNFNYLKTNPNRYTQWQEIASGCADAEPDAYFFNFNGYSGSFSFKEYSQGSRVYIYSTNDWKVQDLHADANNVKKITGWKFTCDDGVVYTFTAAEQATIIDNGISCQNGVVYNSAWYLTNITSPNGGRSINFTYETYSLNFDVNQSMTQRVFCYPNAAGCQTTAPTPTVSYTKMAYAGQRIKTITTSDNGTSVTFNYLTTRTDEPGTNLKQLDEIIINNKDNVLFRKFNLGYDYSTGRLTLKSIKKTGTNEPPYLFDYSLFTLPPRISNGGNAASWGQDHWGYYNGKNNSASLLPPVWKSDPSSSTANLIYYPGADRRVNGTYTGMLTKITYPEGGTDEFLYESNDYSKVGRKTMQELGNFLSEKKFMSITVSSTAQNLEPIIDFQTPTVIGNDGNMVDVTLTMSGCNVLQTGGTAMIMISKDDGNDPGTSVFYSKNFPFQMTPAKSSATIKLPSGGRYLVRAIAGGTTPPVAGHPEIPINSSTASVTVQWKAEEPTTIPLKYKLAGGARISSIKSSAFPNDQNVMIREYRYVSDQGISSGVLNEEPLYEVKNLKYYTANETSCLYDLRIAQHKAVLGYGPPVMYGQVMEFSAVDASNGKTVYRFNIPAENPTNGQPPFQLSTSNNRHAQGAFSSKNIFKRVDKSYQLVSEITPGSVTDFYGGENVEAVKISFDGGANTPTKFHAGYYNIQYGIWHPTFTFKREYSTDGNSYVETMTQREYYHQYLTNEKTIHGNNTNYTDETEYWYVKDFQNPTPAIQSLVNKNITATPLEIVKKRSKGDNTSNFVYTGATLNLSALDASSRIFPSTVQTLQLSEPSSTYMYAYSNSNGSADPRFVTLNTLEKFDAKENLSQFTGKDGVTNSFLWDKHNAEPVVKAIGVAADKMAWSGFENTDPVTYGGPWTLNGSYVTTDFATGKRCFTGSISVITTGFSPVSYVLSFWMKGTNAFSVGAFSVPATATWTYYEKIITPGRPVDINTNAGLIDELRIYPVGAQLTTYGYNQLLGTNTVADVKSKPTFYETDNLGRLYLIRDQNKDIVKRVNYEYDVLNPVNYTLTSTQTGNYTYQFQVQGGVAGYTYEWDFQDLTAVTTTTAASTTHTFPSLTLKFPVIVKVKSSTNVLATLTTEVTVTKQGGSNVICNEGDFTVTKLAQPVNTFNFQVPAITGAFYYWDLGNGNAAQGTSCQQTYAKGDYTVNLTISVAGKSCSTSKNITAPH